MQIKTREHQLLREVTQLREEMAKLQQTNRELQHALTAASEQGNLITAQLHHTNRQLQVEIEARHRTELSLEALVEVVAEHQGDLEGVLQLINQHDGQAVSLRQQLAVCTTSLLATATEDVVQFANRCRFDRYLEQQWKQMARQQSFLTVVLCRVSRVQSSQNPDNAAELALAQTPIYQQIAAIFDRTIKRAADLTIRHSATEFALILPRTSVNGARILAQQLQTGVAALPSSQAHNLQSDRALRLALSVSIASTKPTMDCDRSPRILIDEAARLLHLATQHDSDRILHAFLE